MKPTLRILLLFLFAMPLTVAAQDTLAKKVSFTGRIDIRNATKDGIYMNGYVVNIPFGELQNLNGKKVRISGKVTRVKAAVIDGEGRVVQGRAVDSWQLLKPKVKVLAD